jgi:hypothetical protein
MKKPLIATFLGTPFFLIILVNLIAPAISNDQILGLELGEPYLKHALFLKRPLVDTVISGDSRVMRIIPGPFLKRGWAPFDWGLSGLDPGDIAMSVRHAFVYGKPKRVVLGVSFESMAEPSPYMTSRYIYIFPFTDPRINRSWGLDEKAGLKQKLWQVKKDLGNFWRATKARVQARRQYFVYKYIQHRQPADIFDAYGNEYYAEIRKQISAGTFDAGNRDPTGYFQREDGEAGFLKYKKLSGQAMAIYTRLLDELRRAKVPSLVFETARTVQYQAMIDGDPLLKRLNEQWREFFRKQSYGGIKFIEAKDLAPYYHFEDFFDPVHFIGGKTEEELPEKLAAELQALESSAKGGL